jgi:hypothetical protein
MLPLSAIHANSKLSLAAFCRNRDELSAKQIQSDGIPMHRLHSGFWGSPLYRVAQFRGAVFVVVGFGLALVSVWHPLAAVASIARATSANAARWVDRRTNMHTSRGRCLHPVEAVLGRSKENPTKKRLALAVLLADDEISGVKLIAHQ